MPKRVLIADDSESMHTVLKNFIAEQPGVEVCALTANGIDTIDAAMALQPDLLILDVRMPGLNGVEVASVLRKNLPSAKTVLFTIMGIFLARLWRPRLERMRFWPRPMGCRLLQGRFSR